MRSLSLPPLALLLASCSYSGSGEGGVPPSSNRFEMASRRSGNVVAALSNGDVLVAGGRDERGAVLASAEVFDQSRRSNEVSGDEMVLTGPMAGGRESFTATTLGSGQVLVAGGTADPRAERYVPDLAEPAGGRFEITAGGLLIPRRRHAAALLADGRVLVAGGDDAQTGAPLASAELYDPASDGFIATGPLNVARAEFTLTRLPDGRVLAAGGRVGSGDPTDTAEVWDPLSGAWTRVNVLNGGQPELGFGRFAHAAVLMTNGTAIPGDDRVAFFGGTGIAGGPIREVELFDPGTLRFSVAGDVDMPASSDLAAVEMADGSVVVLGGFTRRKGGGPTAPTRETAVVRLAPTAATAGAQDLTVRVGGMAAVGIARSGTHTGTEVFYAGGVGDDGLPRPYAYLFDPFTLDEAVENTLDDEEMLIAAVIASIFGYLNDFAYGTSQVELEVEEDPVEGVVVHGDAPRVDLEFDAGSMEGEAASESFEMGIFGTRVEADDLEFTIGSDSVSGSMQLDELDFKIDADRSSDEVKGVVFGLNNSAFCRFRIKFSGRGTDPGNSWIKIYY